MPVLPTSSRYFFPSFSSGSLLAHLPIVVVGAAFDLLLVTMNGIECLLRRTGSSLMHYTRLQVPIYAILVPCHAIQVLASTVFQYVMARTRGCLGIFIVHYVSFTVILSSILYVMEAWFILFAWLFYDVRDIFFRSS